MARCTPQAMFLFSVPDTAARRYGFSGDLVQCPRDPARDATCSSRPAGTRRSTCAARSTAWRRSPSRQPLWVVVDDGSTDDTPAILEEYARRLPYLRVVRRADRGRRQVGPGVIEAFYAGLETVRLEDFDYLCKLDMDLDLPPRYFELLMQRMESRSAARHHLGKTHSSHPRAGSWCRRFAATRCRSA